MKNLRLFFVFALAILASFAFSQKIDIDWRNSAILSNIMDGYQTSTFPSLTTHVGNKTNYVYESGNQIAAWSLKRLGPDATFVGFTATAFGADYLIQKYAKKQSTLLYIAWYALETSVILQNRRTGTKGFPLLILDVKL